MRQLCSKHYQQFRNDKKKGGGWDKIKRTLGNTTCSVEGCGDEYLAGGMCQKHYSQEIKRKNREFILVRYFSSGVICKRCNKQYDIKQMDAHHSDPEKKEHILSDILNNSALMRRPSLLAELDECEFICARCHQNIHQDIIKTHEETYLRKDKGRKIDAMKEKIRKQFGENCSKCGDWLYPKEMEFHHRERSEKVGNVSDIIRFTSEEKVFEEVKKCDIVCRNCHRIAI